MARTPFPKGGCYTASYPRTQWQEVPCSTTPGRPHNQYNDSALVLGSPLSSATGSFDSVIGATEVTDSLAGPNYFSLQLNSGGLNSPLCGSGNPNCAIQQFIYDSPSPPGGVYIQYWLRGLSTCPPSQTVTVGPKGNHWTLLQGSGCWINGNTFIPPTQVITDLAKLRLTGSSSSFQQSARLEAADGTMYGSPDDGDFLSIFNSWVQAEFNVFGWCCGSQAVLTPAPGTTVVVRTSVDDGTTNAPSIGGPITVETNNLPLVPPACPFGAIGGALPALVFTESNTPGVTSPCLCPPGQVWVPNVGACGPPAAQCTTLGVCDGPQSWDISISCTGMNVSILYGSCPSISPGGSPQPCISSCQDVNGNPCTPPNAGWDGSWGAPDYAGLQPATVCTSGVGQPNCYQYMPTGLPECPPPPRRPPPPVCANGWRYCYNFSPHMCMPEKLCAVMPVHPPTPAPP